MVNLYSGMRVVPGAYPGFHTLIDKSPGDPISTSWQCQNDGDVNAVVHLELSLDAAIFAVGNNQQVPVGQLATIVLNTTYPPTVSTGLHNGQLDMIANEPGGTPVLVASHTFTVDFPAPPLGLIVTPIGDPTIV